MPPEIQTFLLAMTPIGGLRLSIPIALAIYRLDWPLVYLISLIGSLAPVVPLLLFLKQTSTWLSKRFKIFQQFFSWYSARTREKYKTEIKKYGRFALVAFVALPLPFSSGWTGSLVALLFGFPFKKAFSLIALGNIIDGLIILVATQAGIAVEKYFGWQVLVGIILVAGFIWFLFKIKRNKKCH